MDPKAATEIPKAGGRAVDSSWVASPPSRLALMLERAARVSLRLGDQANRPLRRKSGPAAPDLACGLYRQSVYYSLRALQLLPPLAPGEVAPLTPANDGRNDFASVFRAAPVSLLASAAGGVERVPALEQRLCASTFVDFSLSEPSEAGALALELQGFTRALVAAVEARQRRLEHMAAARSFRILALAGLVALVGLALLIVPEWWAARRDLAAGKPWQASSVYAGGCTSPDQDCVGDNTYFVHTLHEDEPWLEIDLKTNQKISGLHVVNRTDCCMERGVPLVFEVSSDQKRWREVVRSTEPFREWKPTFAPVAARWVRFRVPRHSALHLKRVRIFP